MPDSVPGHFAVSLLVKSNLRKDIDLSAERLETQIPLLDDITQCSNDWLAARENGPGPTINLYRRIPRQG
jgi:hypothetical protein